MKLKIIAADGKNVGEMQLPKQFEEDLRPDLIKRAVLAIHSHNRQPYGAFPLAGKRYSAETSKRRRDYKGSYGKAISRTPKKVMTHRGDQFYWVGAFAPMTVGGRRAHPPKAWKVWEQKINIKERKKAVRSAISATVNTLLVKARGHNVPENYPFILSDDFENIKTTKKAAEALKKIGLKKELDRTKEKKVRAGIGKMRGRKYKKKVGPLIVVSKECESEKAFHNIPGVEVIQVKFLNAKSLAPGTQPGRLTLFTKPAIELMQKERLFL